MSRKKWVSAVSKGDQQVTQPPSGGEGSNMPTPNEEIVLLLGGFNNFGDKIYNYVKIPMAKVEELIKGVENGGRFDVREFGEVVAAGLGIPTPEVKKEIESTYRMITFPSSDQNS